VARLLGNGSEDLTTTTDALISLKPEKTKSIELGTKWDLLDKKLNLTAAVFRNEVTNVRISDATGTYMGATRKSMASNWALPVRSCPI
jgi:catecholate siderophore receptor